MDEAYSEDGTAYAFRWPYGWIACTTDREDIVTRFYEPHEAASAEEALALFAAETRMQA